MTHPWSRADGVRTAVLVVAGVVIAVVGWYQASGRATPSRQSGPAVVGIVGALVLLGAAVSWLAAGRQAVRTRTRALLGEGSTRREVVLTAIAASPELVAGRGLAHYHRADCPLAAGKGWRPQRRATHERAGRVACGVCLP